MSRADISDPEIKQAFDEVKSGANGTDWMLLGYVPKSDTKLKVVDKGSGGLSECSDQLTNAGKVQYALICFIVNQTKKFVYIPFCGEAVTGLKKGLFNNHANDVALFLKGFHVQINARTESDINEKQILEKLKKATGANYDSGQKNQGEAALVPQNVSQGRQQAAQSNVQKSQADKSDYNKKSESENYWQQQRKEEEAQKQAPKPVPRAEYNRTAEREQFWAQQKQDESAKPAPQRPANVSTSGNAKARFETAAKQSSAPPKQSAPPPPKKQVQPQYEAPKPPPQEDVPPPAEEPPAPPASEPTYEEPAPVQEQSYESQPAYDEPAPVEEQPYSEPQVQEEQWSEQPQEEYQPQPDPPQEQQYDGGATTTYLGQVRALYDYNAENEGDLSFREGEIINIIDNTDPSGWYEGESNGVRGFFPSNFVEEYNG